MEVLEIIQWAVHGVIYCGHKHLLTWSQPVVTGNWAEHGSDVECHLSVHHLSCLWWWEQHPLNLPSTPLPPQHSYALPRSCSQAWQGFTHDTAEFKVRFGPPRDIRGCFKLHACTSFVYSWCLRSVVGYCCDVAYEVMNGF